MAHEITSSNRLLAYIRLVHVGMTHHGPLYVGFGYQTIINAPKGSINLERLPITFCFFTLLGPTAEDRHGCAP
jgi:hypothetical protein